jgi:hypothetical protein
MQIYDSQQDIKGMPRRPRKCKNFMAKRRRVFLNSLKNVYLQADLHKGI